MKRSFCAALSILLGLTLSIHANSATAEPSPPAILLDAATGEVLSAERAGEPWYPASLSKLMTAYVVFHKIRARQLTPDQKIPVSILASAQAPSKVGIPPGNIVSVDWALQAMLVYSANDMAVVLAEAAGGSVAGFAAEMNKAAKELGMSATHFVNPNGLFDPRQVTSARDLGVLAAVMLKQFPEHAEYFDQDFLTLGKRRLSNRNSLLRQMPEADGMKTGFVCNSGFNLVASATRSGRKLIAVVLGAKSGYGRAVAAQGLLEDGFLKPSNPAGAKIAWIANVQPGAIAPVDMTAKVCPRKNGALIADIEQLGGWAAMFGTYEDASKADIALRGRLLSPVGLDAPGTGGVVRLPDKSGYAAMIYGLDSIAAIELCNKYRTEAAQCEVQPPLYVQNIVAAEMTGRLLAKQKRAKVVAQGSDVAKARPVKKKKKRIRRNIRS